jgi:hypothetical protein
MRYEQLDQDWKLISFGGEITTIQNRSSVQYEIIMSRDEPATSDKGFIVYEEKITQFSNLPIWARTENYCSISVHETMSVSSEQNNAIHAGTGYSISAIGTIAGDTSLYFLARVGDKQIHFEEFDLKLSAGNVTLELFKDPTITSVGDSVIPDTLNDAANIPCESLIYSGSTISDDGTRKYVSKAFTLGVAEKSESGTAIASGRVLKSNTDYIVKITNLEAVASVQYSISFTFHESNIDLS